MILDGWGMSPDPKISAIEQANTPFIDSLYQNYPHATLKTYGMHVGLPDGQMGNSEVGHITLGSGRVIHQNLSQINNCIKNGDFFSNPAYIKAVDKAIANDTAVHIFGLLSAGGVHSHENHINNSIKLAAKRGAKKIYLHAFLDGRDTPPSSAEESIKTTEAILLDLGVGKIASISGRFYAMDRDKRWDRLEAVYNMLTDDYPEYVASIALSATYSG